MSENDLQKQLGLNFQQLFNAIENLEKITIDKLHETSLQSSVLSVSNDDNSVKNRIIEQNAIIQNLNHEINQLQESILNITTENENLVGQNESLLKKINYLRFESKSLVDDIESDLVKISKIIEEKCQ